MLARDDNGRSNDDLGPPSGGLPRESPFQDRMNSLSGIGIGLQDAIGIGNQVEFVVESVVAPRADIDRLS